MWSRSTAGGSHSWCDIAATCTDTMTPTIKANGWSRRARHRPCEEEIDDDCLERMDVKIRQAKAASLERASRIMRLIGHSPVAYVAGTKRKFSGCAEAPSQAEDRSGLAELLRSCYGRAKA